MSGSARKTVRVTTVKQCDMFREKMGSVPRLETQHFQVPPVGTHDTKYGKDMTPGSIGELNL